MNGLLDYELPSPFLTLPAETRLNIYSYLIPSETLDIDLCRPRRPEQADFTIRKRSIVSNLLNQVLNLDAITRSNGLHLLLVSKRTRSEVLPLLRETTVRFHCPRCFEEVLRNLSYGLGVGVTWMRHIEILLDLSQYQQVLGGQLTIDLAKTMARETLQTARKTAWLYHGRLDLCEKEKWKFEIFNPDAKSKSANDMFRPVRLGAHPVFVPAQISPPINFHETARPEQIVAWLISGWFDV